MLILVILISILNSLSLCGFFVSDSPRKANSENYFSPSLSFCFSRNFQRIDTLFSVQFPLTYVVDWDFKILTALWKIVSAQWWFGWEAQGLLPVISSKLSVKLQQCACSHRPDPGCAGIVSPGPVCGLSSGFGWDLLCFSQLNYKILPFFTNFTYQVSTWKYSFYSVSVCLKLWGS